MDCVQTRLLFSGSFHTWRHYRRCADSSTSGLAKGDLHRRAHVSGVACTAKASGHTHSALAFAGSLMCGVSRGLLAGSLAVACRRHLSLVSFGQGCCFAPAQPCRRYSRLRAPAPPVRAARSWQSEVEELAAERAAAASAPARPAAGKGFGAKASLVRKPLSIQLYPSPCLRAANADVSAFDDKLAALARDMFDIMYRRVDASAPWGI